MQMPVTTVSNMIGELQRSRPVKGNVDSKGRMSIQDECCSRRKQMFTVKVTQSIDEVTDLTMMAEELNEVNRRPWK